MSKFWQFINSPVGKGDQDQKQFTFGPQCLTPVSLFKAFSKWIVQLRRFQGTCKLVSLTVTPILPLTFRVLVIYSSLFMRFSWKVIPRNMLLFSVHFSNVTLQGNLLFRRIKYEWENPELVQKEKEEFEQKQAKSKLAAISENSSQILNEASKDVKD